MGQVVADPEQKDAGVNVEPEQVAAAHIAAELAQAPAPSQTLVLPQTVEPPPQPASVVPLDLGAQLPAPFRLHAWHAGQLELPQQTPSTQLPLMHWVPPVQAIPFAFRLQLFALPEPWQVKGAKQSASVVHDDLQAFVPQT
jgi:hypothetical protein